MGTNKRNKLMNNNKKDLLLVERCHKIVTVEIDSKNTLMCIMKLQATIIVKGLISGEQVKYYSIMMSKLRTMKSLLASLL